MTLEKQLGSILKKLKNTVTNIIEIEGTVNSRAESVDTINKDVQAKAEEMKKYVDTMNASVNTLNTLETQISDLKTSVSSTTDRAEKMLKETQAIRDTLTDALVWKGSVENYAALPTKNVRVGDTYNVTAADSAHNINAGDNVVWDGSKWDVMGGIMNVDSLAVKGQDANFKDVTATTFHGALNGKADSATTADVAKTVAWNNIGGKPATFPSDIKFDDVPTTGSSNAVKSSGIKSALDEKISTAGGTLTGNLELSDSNVAISTKGGAISGGDTSISLSSKGTVDFTDSNTGTRTSYISTSDGKYHGDIIGNADRATLAVNDDAGNNIADTYAKKTDLPTVPTKVSAFTNDAGYLTSHQSLAGYASLSKANSYTGVNTFGGATQLNETKIYGTTSFYANNAVVATIAGNQFSGNAATATKATLDSDSNNIADTYVPHYVNIGNMDLDSIRIGGLYAAPLNANATAERHYPEVSHAGSILVMNNGANGENGCTQVYTTFDTHNSYKREYDAETQTWSAWRKYAFEDSTVAKAQKLATPRKINITGNATGSATFDGTSDVSINVTVNSATKATNDSNGANIASTYVKKAGDTTTGKITFASTDLNNLPEVKKTSDDNMSGVRFSSKTKFLGAVGKRLSNGEDLLNLRSDNNTTDVVLDSRNYGSYALPKSGGTMSGALNFVNNTWNAVGDDSYIGDHDISGTFCVKGANGETGIALVNRENESDCARISYGGGNINFNKTIGGNISGNAATATSATTAGNADTSAAIYYSSRGTNYIKVGSADTGDAANKTANMVIGSWYGITFYDVCGGKIAGGMNVRDGSLTMKGTITGSKVYNAVYNDYAEFFEKDENITFEAGDIVALDTSSEEEHYIKATEDSIVVVGVCTHEYAHIIGGKEQTIEENEKEFVPISLMGRVYVKVDGTVKRGDKIAASSVPGIGRKAMPGEHSIGTALTNPYNGKARVLINL